MNSANTGLTHAEAAQLLKSAGHNDLPRASSRGVLKMIFGVLKEPMLLLLVSCASIYFVLGEKSDGAILGLSVFVVIGITLYQEWKSEKAIDALRDLSSPRALVIREGARVRIPGREVVPGDLLVISEGDRIAADAVLITSSHLKVDESLLTGESFAVLKTPVTPGSSDENAAPESRVFSGTLVVAGGGTAQVIATGTQSQLGKIGLSLNDPKDGDRTLLQVELGRMIRVFGLVGAGFSILIVLVYGFTHGDWPQGLLVGLSAAMSLLPEEFPVVLTVFLALGAWRISKVRVLTRRISATESLGSITVLCVDKTGTLTKNEMNLRSLEVEGNLLDLPLAAEAAMTEEYVELLKWSALACPTHPFDPMEKAIHLARIAADPAGSADARSWTLEREYPLSHALLATVYAWRPAEGEAAVVAAKGAPEAVLQLCGRGGPERAAVLERVQALADQGLRVLAVARAQRIEKGYPDDPREFSFELVGLIGFEDPIRPEVPAAMRECDEAGIRVLMMTGDYPGTAVNVAQKIGFKPPFNVMTGQELSELSDLILRDRVKSISVFARMVPEQKLRVIRALRANSEIVAMTGDGVNDAPSLKWADVGIAMGGRGTDVAREAAAIVLLDDNFASIVAAIRMGRRIFDNIRKAVAYIFAVHVPIAGMAMLPVLLRTPLVLLPAHIVFLELVIDPASALLFEGEEAEDDVMKRPPRSLGKRLFGFAEIARYLLQGSVALVAVFAAYAVTLYWSHDDGMTRAVAFAALMLSNLALIVVNRTESSGFFATLRKKNRTFVWLFSGTIAMLILVLSLPVTQKVFKFSAIDWRGVLMACAGGVLTGILSLGLRQLWKRDRR